MTDNNWQVGKQVDVGMVAVGNRLDALFTSVALRAPFTIEAQWSVTYRPLELETIKEACEGAGIALAADTQRGHHQVLVRYGEAGSDGGAVWVRLDKGGMLSVDISAPDRATAAKIMERLRASFPTVNPEETSAVWVDFWYYGPRGPERMRRKIVVPSWTDIVGNYAAKTADAVGAIAGWEKPASSGQLLLWHGLPGTGKTYALRALIWGWRSWCTFHYIADSDHFFGKHADYLMRVLLEEEDATDDDEDVPAKDAAPPWRLLILENAGEFLTVDARQQAGQGFSRFLNVVDGLLGQGLRILLLMTSNEDLGKFHPAAIRPGRCISRVEFRPFLRPEAAAWLAAHGDGHPAVGPALETRTTLAELYARMAGSKSLDSGTAIEQLVGFT